MFGLVISIVCLLLVVFIAWWFFAEHEKMSDHARQKSGYQEIEVEVMGGYSPEHVIEITPEKAGEYGYSCGMNMMHGHMIVE